MNRKPLDREDCEVRAECGDDARNQDSVEVVIEKFRLSDCDE